MVCPHCSEKIGFFSKAINGWGKKFCPHCNAAIKVGIDWKRFALLVVPFAVLGAVIATWIRHRLGFSSVPIGALFGATLIVFTMTLKPDEGR